MVRDQTGVVLEALAVHPVLWWTPVGMIAIGAVDGVEGVSKPGEILIVLKIAGPSTIDAIVDIGRSSDQPEDHIVAAYE